MSVWNPLRGPYPIDGGPRQGVRREPEPHLRSRDSIGSGDRRLREGVGSSREDVSQVGGERRSLRGDVLSPTRDEQGGYRRVRATYPSLVRTRAGRLFGWSRIGQEREVVSLMERYRTWKEKRRQHRLDDTESRVHMEVVDAIVDRQRLHLDAVLADMRSRSRGRSH